MIRRLIQHRLSLYGLSVLFGLLLVQACSRPLDPQESCGFVQNSQYQRVSWKTDKIDLYVDASVPAEYIPSLEAAAEVWNKALGRKLLRIHRTGGGGQAYEPAKDNYSKIYWMTDWDNERTGEQARTTVYWAGTHIYEADVRFNARDFAYFTSSEEPSYDKVHLESLAVHEFGHVLGLAHFSDPSSVMQTHLANGWLRDEPGQVDMASLKCEY